MQRENKELKNEIKALNAALEKMKKEVDQKNDIIKKKDENIEKLTNAYSNLEADHIILKKSNEANNNKCPVCDDNIDDQADIKKHISDKHSNLCNDCETNKKQLEKAKCFLSRAQAIGRELMDEKKTHKNICEFSTNCPHEMACIAPCYYTDISHYESDHDTSEDEKDVNQDDDDAEYADNDVLEKSKNKCNQCNFEGKNQSGLKVHLKADHKIRCKICGFKTTTNVLLKKHMKDMHVFVN